ncbi:hypothetical protein GOQ29_09790 [Clostridium sp. D2Q-14]|uniref:hypothetical protein n=1 Tax=Anaeromonas gelatinilytica TaxID=2683194 RepID=UPI00193B58B5|nr:hypothetical protein [Anaeromonas gelatinilytica]MBS4535904.1 hypothetical protein [Anaeromonas gelatinilytica]
MRLILLVLLIIPVGFFQLIILSDIINTAKKLGKDGTSTVDTTEGCSTTRKSERKSLLYKMN